MGAYEMIIYFLGVCVGILIGYGFSDIKLKTGENDDK